MSEVWLVINRYKMSVFNVYDSKDKAFACAKNLNGFLDNYYVERKRVR